MKRLYRSQTHLLFGLSLLLALPALASESEISSFDQSHSLWNKVLKGYVIVEGPTSWVQYSTLKKNPEELNQYLSQLESVTKTDFSRFSENEKLAFLINAYNALTVKLILDHYPLKSIKDLGGLFSSAWKIKFFTLFGEKHRLDDIEHKMIRKAFNEPRIHSVLVCAAKSCPGLRNEAFTASRLDEQLDNATITFLRDPKRNYFDANARVIYLSSIFKWYGDDFDKKYGSIKAFIAPRIAKNPTEETMIRNDATVIKYLNYDWSLNAKD